MFRRTRVFLSVLGPLSVCVAGGMEEPASPEAADWATLRAETFEQVWSTVNRSYFDPAFGGVDWAGVREDYAPRVAETQNKDTLRDVLQAMLGELGRSHFAILNRDVSVFTEEEQDRSGTVGVRLVESGGSVLVAEVAPGSAAAEAGLRVGDKIRQVDGRSLDELAQACAATEMSEARRSHFLKNAVEQPLNAEVGGAVGVEVENPAGETRMVSLRREARGGEWTEPLGNLPSVPLDLTAERGEDGVAYLRFSSFTPSLMKRIRPFVRELRPADGLILDLRGNPGGVLWMANGLAGFLTEEEFSLGQMRMREGVTTFVVTPQARAFTGPIAILIDHGSASTSEVLAAGLREAGRARIFGEASLGAALPSAFVRLPTGDLFQYAIADLVTPGGATLEGVGVTPDDTVSATREDIAGLRDPAREAATAWLARERSAEKPAPEAP